jgi:hypothetical protein
MVMLSLSATLLLVLLQSTTCVFLIGGTLGVGGACGWFYGATVMLDLFL